MLFGRTILLLGTRMNVNDRFDAKVRLDESGCHLWVGRIMHKGYGHFSVGTTTVRAHRFAYERKHGPIPNWMMVCHKCDVRACVNPDHLFLGTAQDNMQDCVSKGRAVNCGTSGRDQSGEKNYRAVLNEGKVKQIRADVAAGMSRRAAGRKYGVHFQTVTAIILGRSWAGV